MPACLNTLSLCSSHGWFSSHLLGLGLNGTSLEKLFLTILSGFSLTLCALLISFLMLLPGC